MAKAPRKPKKSAPESSWVKYDQRKTEYDRSKKRKDSLIKKYSK